MDKIDIEVTDEEMEVFLHKLFSRRHSAEGEGEGEIMTTTPENLMYLAVIDQQQMDQKDTETVERLKTAGYIITALPVQPESDTSDVTEFKLAALQEMVDGYLQQGTLIDHLVFVDMLAKDQIINPPVGIENGVCCADLAMYRRWAEQEQQEEIGE